MPISERTNMASDTISVIMPAYNAAQWIGEALDSVAAQTCDLSQLEVIVVDDGSSDRTVEIATAAMAGRLPRGRVLPLACNGGVSAARNAGARAARGTWLQFFDADDLLAPDKIAAQVQVMRSAPADVGAVFSPWQKYEEQAGQWAPAGLVVSQDIGADPVLDIMRQTFGLLGPMLFRASAVAAIDGFRVGLRLCEDQEFCLRLAMAGHRIVKVETAAPIMYYRQSPGSSVARLINDASAIDQLYDVYREIEAYLCTRAGGAMTAAEKLVFVGRYDHHIRELYDLDRGVFQKTLAHIRSLDPNYLPIGRARMRTLSKWLGYETAEWLGAKGRQAARLMRGPRRTVPR